MDKTGIGDRMKKYEKAFNDVYPIRLPLILRLDGKSFHQMVKKWKCKKPFDNDLIEAMWFTAMTLCKRIPGAQIAYIQSDEITILVRDDMTISSQPWFDKKQNKILSVSASIASNAFNYHGLKLKDRTDSSYDALTDHSIELSEMAEFDCRGFVVPEYEIINSFIFRQQDATRNSIQMLGRSKFSHKQLNNKNNNEIQEMLWKEHNINWNDLPIHLKRGACIIKKDIPKTVPKRDEKKKVIKGEFETVIRSLWSVDKEIPIFTQDKNYINQYAKICEE